MNPNETMQQAIDYNAKIERIIATLLKGQGIVGPWVAFGTINEGKHLPDEVESESGMILTQDGRVFTYWLGWDEDKIASDGTKGWYTLGENFKDPQTGEPHPLFREVKPDPSDSSFLTAKKKLGIA